MSKYVTEYKKENGKTHKVKGKDGAPDKAGADNKNSQPAAPAK